MKIYLASGLQNIERAREVRDWLRGAGYEITYDWMQHGPAGDRGFSHMAKVAKAECDGVRAADCVVVLLPGGRGTHAELGMALAMNKNVLLWDESVSEWRVSNDTCAFYWHPNVLRGAGSLGPGCADLLEKLEWSGWKCLPPMLSPADFRGKTLLEQVEAEDFAG